MERSSHHVLVHGLVGGLLAGAVVALWFLVVDVVAGDPLRTPAELARTLFGAEAAGGGSLIVPYTVVHAGAFAALGVLAAWFLSVGGISPGWLAGAVFGIVVLNAAHYGSLLVTGGDALAVLPWPHVVGANLAAGLVLMTWLHRAGRVADPLGPAALRGHPILAEGLLTGLVGAAAVAAWFFVLDVAAGAALRTPAALGSVLFLGAESPAQVEVGLGVVLAYTVVHLAAFAGAGVLFVAVARQVERVPPLAYMVLLAFLILEATSFGFLVTFAGWVVGELSLWAIGVGNLVGVAAMGGWVWRRRPLLRERVAREGFSSAA